MPKQQMGGGESQGPLPAGILRIHQGSQERYVWPVHLSGWLAVGWRLAGPSPAGEPGSAAAALSPEPSSPALGEPTPDADAPAASPRGRRGRRRKEESSCTVAELPVTQQQDPLEAPVEAADTSEAEPPADPELSSDLALEADSEAAAEPEDLIPVLTALPAMTSSTTR